MINKNKSTDQTQRFATLVAAANADALRAELMALLEQPGAAVGLRALDQAGLLTQIIPELEPARATDQPNVHFLPVLGHMLETVAVVEWLLTELQGATDDRPFDAAPGKQPTTDDRRPTTDEQRTTKDERRTTNDEPRASNRQSAIPVAVQAHPDLHYRSAYAEELRRHFAEAVGGYPRPALFKLAALLHDIAKPATKQLKPGGGVSFHEHQTIGGEVVLAVARRLGFSDEAARYIRLVVREHMRPGQLGVLDEVTERAVARFFFATAGAGPDVLLHLLADHMATRGPRINVAGWLLQAAWVDALLETIWGEVIEPTRPLLNGNQLMLALGLKPGPLVGRLLARIGEAQASGEINTSEEAIGLAKKILTEGRRS